MLVTPYKIPIFWVQIIDGIIENKCIIKRLFFQTKKFGKLKNIKIFL